MLNIIKFQGGLGNTMFQYAFFMAMKYRHPCSLFIFDIEDAKQWHYGFELQRLFKAFPNWRVFLFSIIKRSNYIYHLFYKRSEPDNLLFCPDVLFNSAFDNNYIGFWQSEKYFSEIKDSVRLFFSFDEKLVSEENKSLLNNISKKYISIHVRRGDFLKESFRLTCDKDYYIRAVNYIKKNIKDPQFLIFSDDLNWCKNEMPIDDAIYVSWNKGKESWQDMYLMSKCSHNIIANSSFSWWGAWLNNNPEKIVIAPQEWFKNKKDDIIPETWIRM